MFFSISMIKQPPYVKIMFLFAYDQHPYYKLNFYKKLYKNKKDFHKILGEIFKKKVKFLDLL